jgi:hypothetical protein
MLDDRGAPGRDEGGGRDDELGPGGTAAVDADLPASIERECLLHGHAVTLGDGREWTVSVLRTLDGETTLPRGREFGPDGKWREGSVRPEYADLAARVEAFWESWLGLVTEGGELTVQDADRLAAEVLGVNYKLAPADVERLGLLDESGIRNVLLAAVDWPTAAEVLAGEGGE